MNSEFRYKIARTLGIAAILFFFATWLIGSVVFIEGIYSDLDAILDLIFDGWTPTGIRTAADALGIPASTPAWAWFGIELILLISFGAVGMVLFLKKRDGFGIYLGAAFALIGTRISGPVTFSLAMIYPPAEFLMIFLSGLAFVVFGFLLYLFPNGKFVPRWSPWLIPILVIWLVLSVLAEQSFMSFNIDSIFIPLGFFALGLIAQGYRYRRVSTSAERRQTRGVLIAFCLFFVVVSGVFFIVPNAMNQTMPPTPQDLAGFLIFYVVLTVTTMLFILALAIAILRYQLYDIDLIIRRTISYGILTVLLGLVYFGSILILQRLFTVFTRQDTPITIVISTLVIAAIFNPLRVRVQNFIDKRFYRQGYNAQQALARFAVSARNEVEIERLAGDILSVVDKTIQPEKTSLWLRINTSNVIKDQSQKLWKGH